MRKLLTIIMTVFALPLFAAVPNPASAIDLNLEQAVSKIMAASNDVKKAELNIRKAQASYNTARAGRFPKLDAFAAYEHNVNLNNPGSPAYIAVGGQLVQTPDKYLAVGLDASMPIYTFGKLGYGLDAAESAVKIAGSSAELARREMRVAAVKLYYGAKMSEEILRITEKSLSNARKNLRALSAGAGRANKANLLKISADIALKESQVADAKFNAESAMRTFKIMADIAPDTEVVLVDEIPSKFNKITDAKMDSFPEWDIYKETYDANRASMKSKYAGWLPTLAATAQYNYYKSHTEWEVWRGESSRDATVGLVLSLPILDGGAARYAATQDARAANIAAEDLDKSKKMRRLELDDGIEKHNYMIDNLITQVKALDLAQKTYKMSADRFATGQTSAVELSDVEASLVQLEIANLNTRMQIAVEKENINKLVGKQ